MLNQPESNKENWYSILLSYFRIDNLTNSVIHQNKLVKNGKFNPIEYFGCEYMKDYKFYLNNPCLEIVFNDNETNKISDEILINSNFGTIDTTNMNSIDTNKHENTNSFSQSSQNSKVNLNF